MADDWKRQDGGGTSCTLIMKVESIDTVSLCTQYYAGELVITFLS